MPVAVGSLASAVGAALVTAISGTAGVAGLEDRAGRDGGGEEGSEEDGELHFGCRSGCFCCCCCWLSEVDGLIDEDED